MEIDASDIVIVGSGPAGLTAAIYAVRGGAKTMMLAGTRWGGQLMLTTAVENYPGFPEGIQGPQLMLAMRGQAERLGVAIINRDVSEVDFSQHPFRLVADNQNYLARSVILATGATDRWLGVPGELQLIGRGVSSCAPCDAPFFKDKRVIVVGGGDSAMEEANVLSKFASGVAIIHRREEFRASKVMQERVLANPKVQVIKSTTVTGVFGVERVTGVRLLTGGVPFEKQMEVETLIGEREGKIVERRGDGFVWDMPTEGVFVAIGHDPATKIFAGKLEMDEKGYLKKVQNPKFRMQNEKGEIIGNKYQMMASVEGIFVAGDVHDYRYKQAVTAAGFGCQAALEAIGWLEEEA